METLAYQYIANQKRKRERSAKESSESAMFSRIPHGNAPYNSFSSRHVPVLAVNL